MSISARRFTVWLKLQDGADAAKVVGDYGKECTVVCGHKFSTAGRACGTARSATTGASGPQLGPDGPLRNTAARKSAAATRWTKTIE